MPVTRLQSPPRRTPFAPVWDYHLYSEFIDPIDIVQHMKDIILSKEKSIIEEFSGKGHDGSTGLGAETLTGKFTYYNIFDWSEPVFTFFKNWVREQHDNFRKEIGLPPVPVWGKCWANVMRHGQKIEAHNHGAEPESYLSGHFTVATTDTNTYYDYPYDTDQHWVEKNIPGLLTLFPSCITHWTDTYQGNEERISIAFDLYPEHLHLGSGADKKFFLESPCVKL